MLKMLKMIMHVIILYGIYLLGNWIQITFNLFIPGSVIGMMLLLVFLLTNIIKVTWIEEGSKLIINHLTLFFIPATVGIMNYFALFKGNGFLLVVIALLSTALVMAVSGVLSQWFIRRKEVSHDQ